MSARSRNPDTESFGIESSSVLASSRLQTGVLPFLTTYFGPRTEWAGFDGVICRMTRKSYNIRTAASLIVLIRTFLSMSLQLELEGRWPWQHDPPKVKHQGEVSTANARRRASR